MRVFFHVFLYVPENRRTRRYRAVIPIYISNTAAHLENGNIYEVQSIPQFINLRKIFPKVPYPLSVARTAVFEMIAFEKSFASPYFDTYGVYGRLGDLWRTSAKWTQACNIHLSPRILYRVCITESPSYYKVSNESEFTSTF